jgi:hypothetical protein
MDRETTTGTVGRNRIYLKKDSPQISILKNMYCDDVSCYWTDLGQSQRTGSLAAATKPSRRTWRCVSYNKTNRSCGGKRNSGNIRADLGRASEYVFAVWRTVERLYGGLSIKTGTRWRLAEPLTSPPEMLTVASGKWTRNLMLIHDPEGQELETGPMYYWLALTSFAVVQKQRYTSEAKLRGKKRFMDWFVWYVTTLLQLRSLFSIEWDD